MIIESDDMVLTLEQPSEQNEGRTVKAVHSAYCDEWIVFTENEYGELSIKLMVEMELEEEYGPFPTDTD
jgi:hypothetical protein